jgi:hypothetical protein
MGIDVAAFWIGLAAVIVAVMWRRRHTEALRHETLRTMIEKNAEVDEKLLNDILNPPVRENRWTHATGPGEALEAYRVIQFLGSMVMIVSPGVAIFAGLIASFEVGGDPQAWAPVGLGFGLIAMIVGLALFYSARFLRKRGRDSDQR